MANTRLGDEDDSSLLSGKSTSISFLLGKVGFLNKTPGKNLDAHVEEFAENRTKSVEAPKRKSSVTVQPLASSAPVTLYIPTPSSQKANALRSAKSEEDFNPRRPGQK